MSVTDAQDLPVDKLSTYLSQNVAGFCQLQQIKKFPDGQSNPTYLITATSGEYVLRRQPFGDLLKSAHAVDREYRVMRALRKSQVPVPKVVHLCQDRAVIGCLFYLMSFESGKVYWDPALPTFKPAERAKTYDEMNRVLASLHDVDVNAAGLLDFGKPGNYFERQISRWTQQYFASETTPIKAMHKLIDWLPVHNPADDGKVSLIHGDYRLDNIIFNPATLQVQAVLDWELSTLGHPYADLAYQCMQLRMPHDCIIAGLSDIDRGALGIPSELEYVAAYCQRRQIDSIPNWSFYLVFSFFRFAAILQGVNKRALDGNASSKKARQYGALAPVLAERALDLTNAL